MAVATDATFTLTMVFSDVEGSTRLLERLGEQYDGLLRSYHALVADITAAHGGTVVQTQGDGHFLTFDSAASGVLAAVELQQALASARFPGGAEVRARIGIHTGEVRTSRAGYVGLDIHRAARIGAAGHGGQILVSERTVAGAGDALATLTLRSLGEHRLKDLSRPQMLYEVAVPGEHAEFPPIRTLTTRTGNLPAESAGFVGRSEETERALGTLRTQRLVSLVGPGGVGKTRLVLRVAARAAGEHAAGAWFVDLAPLGGGSQVAPEVARVLGVDERSAASTSVAVFDHVGDRDLLLVLDNCEHVLDAVAELVGEMLRRCPRVHVLTTSRHRLEIADEAVVMVEPLAQDEAVELFLARARQSRPGFAPGAKEMADVAALCARLDGLPLALELAASRLRAMPLIELAGRLDARLLSAGRRDDAPHHRTLQAAMDWSHDLLDHTEQVLLRRLSVFRGGFTLHSAEVVCTGPSLDMADVLDRLGELVEASLVSIEEGGHLRYRLLETVRAYAADHAAAAGETDSLAAAHAGYFASIVAGGGTDLDADAMAEWMEGVDDDLDDVVEALRWALAAGDHALAVSVAGGLARYLYRRGFYGEARRWLGAVAELPDLPPSEDLATVLRFTAGILQELGERDRALQLMEREANVATAVGSPAAVARSLNLRAGWLWRAGDLAGAADVYRDALDVLPASHPFAATVLLNLGFVTTYMGRIEVAERIAGELEALTGPSGDVDRLRAAVAWQEGDSGTAARLLDRAVAAYRETGMRSHLAKALQEAALVAASTGDPAAEPYGAEALSLYEDMGDIANIAETRCTLGLVAAVRGEAALARERLWYGIEAFASVDRREGVMYGATFAAGLACAAGRWEEAVALHGGAERVRGEMGLHPPAWVRYRIEGELAESQRQLGPARFEAARRAGEEMSLGVLARSAIAVARTEAGVER